MKKALFFILLFSVSLSINATDSNKNTIVLDCSVYDYINATGFLDEYDFCGDLVYVGVDAPTNSLNAGDKFGTSYSIGGGWYEGYVNYNGDSYRFAYELNGLGNITQVMVTKN